MLHHSITQCFIISILPLGPGPGVNLSGLRFPPLMGSGFAPCPRALVSPLTGLGFAPAGLEFHPLIGSGFTSSGLWSHPSWAQYSPLKDSALAPSLAQALPLRSSGFPFLAVSGPGLKPNPCWIYRQSRASWAQKGLPTFPPSPFLVLR